MVLGISDIQEYVLGSRDCPENCIEEQREGKENKVRTYFKRNSKQLFLLLVILYGLAFSAIIRANFYYVDDLGRARWGYQEFDTLSRYAAFYGSIILHTDSFLSDISPLPQYIAVAVLALASMLLIYVLADEENISIWQVAASLPLGLSPFFLQCISYKFDSPYMALSILGMVAPLAFSEKSTKVYCSAVFLGTLLMCTTYQAASGILPVLVIAVAFSRWNRGEKSSTVVKFILASACAYCLGMLFYRFVIFHPVNNDGNYISTSLLGIQELFTGAYNNIARYYAYISQDFRPIWKLLIVIIIIGYLVLQIAQSRRHRFLAFLMAVFSLIAMCGFIFGVYPALERPLFDPRAMYSFGVFLAIISIQCCSSHILNKKYILKVSCFALSWCFFVFSFTYGNALYSQKKYTDFRIEMVIDDLTDCEVLNSDAEKNVKLVGTIGHSPELQNTMNKYRMLHRLVPPTFDGSGWMWSYQYFFNYWSLKNMHPDFTIDMESLNLPILKDTMYHTIKSDGVNILIELKP